MTINLDDFNLETDTLDEAYATARDVPLGTAAAHASYTEIEQENARLRLALRELRHRCGNQWQLLLGLADREKMQDSLTAAAGSSVRLRHTLYAFTMLNSALDTSLDASMSGRRVSVRTSLKSTLELLQAATEKDALSFEVQDALLSEQGCTALMLICAELVCNAAKYGKQSTYVTFTADTGRGILEVRDDGPGFPAGFHVSEQGREGLPLVEALCHFDLAGEMLCWSEASGGVVTLTFPVLSMPAPTPIVDALKVENVPAEWAANGSICDMEGVVCPEYN